jgi:anti-anti-sigma regulatory factor
MPTQITQVDDPTSSKAIFRIEGQMLIEDAQLLDRIVKEFAETTGRPVDIDLADIDFIDSEAGSILKRLELDGFALTGVEILLQNAVNEAERH